MKQIDKKDMPEISGGVMPGDDGGCTDPPRFPPLEDFPRNPLGPYEPDQVCPDLVE